MLGKYSEYSFQTRRPPKKKESALAIFREIKWQEVRCSGKLSENAEKRGLNKEELLVALHDWSFVFNCLLDGELVEGPYNSE